MNQYKHISEIERGKIEVLWKKGYKQAEIARELNRSKSTISREIVRSQEFQVYKDYSPKHRQKIYKYIAMIAGGNARFRISKCGNRSKINGDMIAAIKEGYNHHWSPEQIVHGSGCMEVCTNTVYNWILQGKIPGGPQSGVKKYRRSTKRTKEALSERTRKMISTRSIETRPEIINKRERFGDWEIDCILPSRESKKCIVTFNERKTRFLFMSFVKNQSATAMIPAIDTFMSLYGDTVKSITCDHGKEFANSTFLYSFESQGVDVYFAHAYMPQERGTNENSNGLIRAYVPKKQTFEKNLKKTSKI